MTQHAKKIIPYADLLEKVQSLLVIYAECHNIHIDGIEVYREHIDGANWHVTRYRRSGSDHDWTECHDKIAAEIRHLRACYDVAEGGS